MARKLKTFTTSAGFFDLAVAAPSMKAALEAWGADANLFHQGFAQETDDRAIVTATMARPGVVLRRPVGTHGKFTVDAEVSGAAFAGKAKVAAKTQAKSEPNSEVPPKTSRQAPARPEATKPDRKAALAYEKERKRRALQAQKEEAAQEREGQRRDRAIAAAQAVLEEAEAAHVRSVKEIEKAQAALDRKSAAEETRWKTEKEKLQDALREARAPRHLRLV